MTKRAAVVARTMILLAALHSIAGAQVTPPPVREDSVTLSILNTDLRSAIQMMQPYIDRPILFSGQGVTQVNLETPVPVPKSHVIRLLRGLLESQGYDLVADTAAGLYRARQRNTSNNIIPPPTGGVVPAPRTQAQQQAVPELFMISLKHARAADIAMTINALYGREPSFGAFPGRPSTLSDELRANQVPPTGPPPPQAVPGTAGRSAALTGDLTIVPDNRANTLVVRANRTDFDLINALVQQLDVRPLQTLIEVLVAEVRRDRSLTIGVDATLGQTSLGKNGVSMKGGLSSPGLGDFALAVMQVGGLDLDATIKAVAERGDIRIVSRPVVIAANNQQAEIVVGSQRPFVQVSRALPTDGAVRDQIVQYKDVGIKLTVKPTISGDGSVQLEVSQEVSSATSETAFNAPVISTRSVQTQLLVRDGQTVTLGGLTDQQRDVGSRGIPILSSIPLIGGLFGQSSRRTTETELFVFITPRVIRTDEDAARLSDPLLKKAGTIKK
jgi:general secretion pathway protein D